MSHKKKHSGRSLTKLALFDERDKMHPRNETYEGIEDFTGLVRKRSKTDLVFLIIYILCNLVAVILFYFSVSTQDLDRLDSGYDFRGDACGKPGTTVEDKPFVFFQDPQHQGTIAMCVTGCPVTTSQEICFYDVDGKTLLDDYCYFSYVTINIGRFCVPPEMGRNRTIIESRTRSTEEVLKTAAYDLYTTYDTFVIGLIIIFAFSAIFIVTVLLSKTRKIALAAFAIGTGLFGINIIALFFLEYKKHIEEECFGGTYQSGCLGSRAFFLAGMGVIMIFVLIGFYFYLFKNRDKIKLAANKFNAEKLLKPIMEVKTMLIYLVLQFAFQVFIVVFFVIAFIMMLASGKMTLLTTTNDFPNETYFAIKHPTYMKTALVFYVLMFLWNMGNTLIFGRMVVTAAVSTWYFSREKSILDLPLFRGFKYTTRFHIGTIAFGSICCAINWPFKSFFGIIKNRLKKIRNRKSRSFRFWMSSCNLTLEFYERVLKYVSNKNFMQTAIFGEEFCVSGVRVFYLKFRNESRLKLLKNVIGFYLMIGKLFVTFASSAIIYNMIFFSKKSPLGQELTYIQFRFVPAIGLFVVGLFLAQTFTSIFDMVIDTLFFCFICDEEMFSGKQRYAEPELRELMDMYGKEAKRADDELDVRARPKQFNAEDENSLIDDNIFVTEHPNKDDKKDDKKNEDDEHGDQEYKVLQLEDGHSAISDNALSVNGITARSRLDNKQEEKKEGDFGFKGINFGGNESDDDTTMQPSMKGNAIRNEWNSRVNNHEDEKEEDSEEESEEDDDEDDDEEDEDEEDENQQQQQQNTANFEGGNNPNNNPNNNNPNLIDTTMFKSNKNPKMMSEDSEDEEDLEANNNTFDNPVKPFKAQNFLF